LVRNVIPAFRHTERFTHDLGKAFYEENLRGVSELMRAGETASRAMGRPLTSLRGATSKDILPEPY
jgi:hypothetical protein